MDFLRTVLKIPVPEVFTYSTSSDNPVGAEYILMERVAGGSLSSRWLSLTTDEVKDIMTQLADIERRIFDFPVPAHGSLYHKRTLMGKLRYPSRTISISAVWLVDNFGTTNEAQRKLTVGPVCSYLLSLLPSFYFLLEKRYT
jgi:hypothetical protein